MAAAAVSACGSANKVAVVDVQKVQQDSAKIQAIQKEITDKNAEIQNRLTTDSQAGLSDEDMQKKGTGSAAGENDFLYKANRNRSSQWWKHKARLLQKKRI